MNTRELKNLVADGESERLELKRSTGQRTEATKSVCAMLNGMGGFVVFGVTDRREIVGQQVTAKTLEDIAAELRRIEPPAFPDIETITVKKDHDVIVLTVPGSAGPYHYDGRPYIRQGPTTMVMPREEYERRLVERLHANRRWENEPVAEGVSIGDLDKQEIQNTMDTAISLGRLEPTGRRDVESILRGLELIREGKLLNAAVALYGKSDRLKTLYPQFSIRLARFRGVNRLADFSDNRQYWGHAFSLLSRAQSFLMDHVPIAGRVVSGKMVREDQPLYPLRATREALANAFCHRDYTVPGGAVAVAMYDDHLEITNPGALHFGITPEKLKVPHESKPWNPIIANVFYRAGIIERWGSGTLNIIDWCTENGNPAPEWQEQAGSVFVTFPPAEPHGAISGKDKDRDQVGTKLGLSRDQVLAMRQVTVGKGIAAILASSGRTNRTKFRDQVLKPLLEAGLVELTIPDKPRSSKQQYRLTEAGKRYLADLDKA
ncbi:MAG: ATP-dependent DNA helicase RecG [Candidatus Hydrogenedentota bacterium]